MNNPVSPYSDSYIVKYPNGDVSLERNLTPPTVLGSQTTVHTVLEGETIQSIAYKYYGDSGMWGIIADINTIFNPFTELEAGMELIIP